MRAALRSFEIVRLGGAAARQQQGGYSRLWGKKAEQEWAKSSLGLVGTSSPEAMSGGSRRVTKQGSPQHESLAPRASDADGTAAPRRSFARPPQGQQGLIVEMAWAQAASGGGRATGNGRRSTARAPQAEHMRTSMPVSSWSSDCQSATTCAGATGRAGEGEVSVQLGMESEQRAAASVDPTTSKWNKIEHRLFSFISINWRGRPLRTHETVVNLIGNTTNRGGLIVRARLDRRKYPTGKKVSAKELSELSIERDAFHGDWNYVIKPRKRRR